MHTDILPSQDDGRHYAGIGAAGAGHVGRATSHDIAPSWVLSQLALAAHCWADWDLDASRTARILAWVVAAAAGAGCSDDCEDSAILGQNGGHGDGEMLSAGEQGRRTFWPTVRMEELV
jgi:hypothetical protein